jgi:hypothetical protein
MQNYVVTERFEKVLKLLRTALAGIDLQVVGEVDLAGSGTGTRAKTLLVACPLLMFEALALDRAAGVFVPLHVQVRADGDRTKISIVDPARLLNARLPVGVASPLSRLIARVELALQEVTHQSVDAGH